MLKSRKTLNKNKSSGFVLDQTILGVSLASGFAVIALGLGAYAILSGSFNNPASATITTEQSTEISTSQPESYSTGLDSTDSSSVNVSTSTADRQPISETNPVKEAPASNTTADRQPISEINPAKEASASNAAVIDVPITHDYLIVWGDTLSELAVSNNVPMSDLVDLNHIQNPDLIYAGNIMKFPN